MISKIILSADLNWRPEIRRYDSGSYFIHGYCIVFDLHT